MSKTKTDEHLIYLAAWAQTQVASSVIQKIKRAFPSLKKAWESGMGDLEFAQLSPGSLQLIRENKPKIDPHKNWELLANKNIHFFTQNSEYYPEYLKEIASAPLFLFAKGDLSALKALHKVAVVGTRKITEYGKRAVDKIVPPLVKSGITIVSGLAYGVDAYAHEVTLKHGGIAIAVLGCSVNRIYPVSNQPLARHILEQNGLIISEYPMGAPPLPQNFPARNRIISGLSKASIIIEAKQQSGSLITANFANEQGRDVYSIPGSIFSEQSEGTNHLIQQGAIPLINPEQIIEQLGVTSGQSLHQQLHFETELERNIYNSLKNPIHIDQLALNLKMEGNQLSQALTMMELRGFIKNLGSMRYCRT